VSLSLVYLVLRLECKCRKRYDDRSRRDRTHLQNEAWKQQLESLTEAYLLWAHSTQSTTQPCSEEFVNCQVVGVDMFGKFNRHLNHIHWPYVLL
jgi:hypothetical protein